MAFITIEPGDGLTPAQRRRAGRAGPSSVLLPTSYDSLLRTAGFVDIEVIDLTAEYRVTQQAKLDQADRHRGALIDLIGVEEYDEGRRERRKTLEAIDAGLLSRRLYLVRRR